MSDIYDDNRQHEQGIYLRQLSLGIAIGKKVAIIGCGGIGSWVSLFLTLAGVEELVLFDSDTISEHNLNRFPLGADSIGMRKSEAMGMHLERLRGGLKVTAKLNFNPEDEGHQQIIMGCDWMVVTTDSLKSRRMCYEYAMKQGIRYIECGAEGDKGTVTFEPALFSTELENDPGYQSVPVFVGPCTAAASIAAYYVLKGYGGRGLTHQVSWDAMRGEVKLDSFIDSDADDSDADAEEDEAATEAEINATYAAENGILLGTELAAEQEE